MMITTTTPELTTEERLDRLEELVDRLGAWVHLMESDLYRRTFGGRPDPQRDYAGNFRAEFGVLNPLNSDEPSLLYVRESDPAGGDPGVRAWIASCRCGGWEEHHDTEDDATDAAREHAERAHREFVELAPGLVGPHQTPRIDAAA